MNGPNVGSGGAAPSVSSLLFNSTITPLASGATFRGNAEQNNAPDVMVSCYSDTAGTLFFDFSVNNTDWRSFPVNGFDIDAGIHEFHTGIKGPRYFRVRFVNSATTQTELQLYTYYGQFGQPNSPLNQPYSLDADSIITRTSFNWLDVSRGLVSGMTAIQKFGRNTAVGTSFAPVALGGVYQTPQASGATTLRVRAGNVNDDAAGTGAQEVTIVGLDENFDDASEAVATAGTSASAATTTTFTRVFRVYVSKSGTYATASTGSHAADIVIETPGGTAWATIDATTFPKSQSEIGAISIHTGQTAYVLLGDITVDTGKTVDAVFFQREGTNETAAPYKAMRAASVMTGLTGGSTNLTGRTVPLGPFTGPCDIGYMARVTSTTGSVSVEFEVFIVDEL